MSPLIYGLPNTHNEHQQDQVLTNKCRSNNHLKWAIVCVEKNIHLCMNWYLNHFYVCNIQLKKYVKCGNI